MSHGARIIEVVDSHTGGEPTRVVLAGGPPLPEAPPAELRSLLSREHDWLRAAVVGEPRGSAHLVGALLCPARDPRCATGVIFFNNVGYLGMCGHGAIGVLATLRFLGRIGPGAHALETPVGVVWAVLHASGAATIRNVPSYRTRARAAVDVPGHGRVHGDVAWGGNWFFLVEDHGLDLSPGNIDELAAACLRLRHALKRQNITGPAGEEVDHIELFGPSRQADSRSFVLCPGGAYDRSPCGTGTSAKLACLAADGKLPPGRVWRQESILGSVFEGSYEVEEGRVVPSITGTAYVTGEGRLILNNEDPFCHGIPL